MPSNVLVSGLSGIEYEGQTFVLNGLYVYEGLVDGRPFYRLNTSNYTTIEWMAELTAWILLEGVSGYLTATEILPVEDRDVAYPWLAPGWTWTNTEGIDPTYLVLTETSDNTIFNLQPSVAAEIINHRGSVKNHLRLRNLGYF